MLSQVLSDDDKRRIYDQYGEAGLKGGMGGFGGASGMGDFQNPFDLFETFFGGGMGGGGFGGMGGGGARTRGVPGDDLRCVPSPNFSQHSCKHWCEPYTTNLAFFFPKSWKLLPSNCADQ